jgi:hypothetical protein
VYINLVEHPARMECGTELAVTVFGPSYRRAAVMQISLAVISFIGSALTYLESEYSMIFKKGTNGIQKTVPLSELVYYPSNHVPLYRAFEMVASLSTAITR